MFLNLDKVNTSSIAVIDDSGYELSYGEMLRFTKEFANILSERSLIFILSENSIGSLCGYITCMCNHVVPLVINNHTEKVLVENLINIYKPSHIWMPQKSDNGLWGDALFEKYDYALFATKFPSYPLYDELSLLLTTSGSTGSSKLVRHSYLNVESNAKNVAQLFDFKSDERSMVMLPMYYTMGLSVITSTLSVGATVLLTKYAVTDKEFWTRLKNEKATNYTGVPYNYEVLLKLRFTRMSLPDLRLISQGGGKLSEETFKTLAEYAHNTGKKFIATYGQTEGTARMAYLPAELATTKICSIGKAIPNGELYLVNEENNIIVSQEATGQLVFKGNNVTLGYAYSIEDLNKKDENNGVLFTGDIAKRDKDGCYYIVGRLNRFIKLYGLRVGLDECESIIRNEFNIECACVGNDQQLIVYITDDSYTQSVSKLLTNKTNIIASAINIIKIEKLPKNEAGKILYTKLNNK